MCIGNNSHVEVQGIGICKLQLRGGHTLLIHEVLHMPSIQRILVFVRVFLEFDFSLNFKGHLLTIYQGKKIYGLAFLSNNFFILDVDLFFSN